MTAVVGSSVGLVILAVFSGGGSSERTLYMFVILGGDFRPWLVLPLRSFGGMIVEEGNWINTKRIAHNLLKRICWMMVITALSELEIQLKFIFSKK